MARSRRRSSQGLTSLSKGSGKGIGPAGSEGGASVSSTSDMRPAAAAPITASMRAAPRARGPSIVASVRRSRRSTSIDFTALSCASSW